MVMEVEGTVTMMSEQEYPKYTHDLEEEVGFFHHSCCGAGSPLLFAVVGCCSCSSGKAA